MSQILNQEEVDALLQGITGGEVETEKGLAPAEDSDIKPYDLTKPDKAVKLPKLVVIIDKFSRMFRITLSNEIRKMAEISHESTDVMKFDNFLKSLPVPVNINIFSMEPLRGLNILTIDSVLVFYFVDVLFGGTGSQQTKIEGREFTSIENTVIKKIAKGILKDWGRAWETIMPLQSQYSRSEVNPQFAMVVPPSELVITISFNIEIENSSGMITICMPYSNLEPIKEKLMSGFQMEQSGMDPFWIKALKAMIQDVVVELKVELGQSHLKGRDLVNLAVGDIIPLDRFVADELDVSVGGIVKFKGQPGKFHGNNAVQISTILTRR